jgi:hypothetical protein
VISFSAAALLLRRSPAVEPEVTLDGNRGWQLILTGHYGLNSIEPPHMVAIQEKIFTPVGTAITMVAATK